MPKTTENKVKKLEWVTKPADATVYDDSFWVKAQRWGTYVSVGANDCDLVTSLTEEQCVEATRGYLKGLQEGWDEHNSFIHEGTVGGKL